MQIYLHFTQLREEIEESSKQSKVRLKIDTNKRPTEGNK